MLGHLVDRGFKYWMILPAVLVILLIGLFPIIYTLIISVQNLTMMDEDTSFHGFIHYADLSATAVFGRRSAIHS